MSEQKKPQTYANKYASSAYSQARESQKNATPRRSSGRYSKKKSKYTEFSKWLLIQETALIWLVTIAFLVLAFICIQNQYFGELPWLTAMAAFPWTAYGVSQAFYYKKATAENTKDGIKYETTMAELTPDDLAMMSDNAVG
jgi:cation transport ATPase